MPAPQNASVLSQIPKQRTYFLLKEGQDHLISVLRFYLLLNSCSEIKSMGNEATWLVLSTCSLKVVSGSQMPVPTSAVRECGGQVRLESAAVIVEDSTALKSQTERQVTPVFLQNSWFSLKTPLCSRGILIWLWIGFSLFRIELSIVMELRDCVT